MKPPHEQSRTGNRSGRDYLPAAATAPDAPRLQCAAQGGANVDSSDTKQCRCTRPTQSPAVPDRRTSVTPCAPAPHTNPTTADRSHSKARGLRRSKTYNHQREQCPSACRQIFRVARPRHAATLTSPCAPARRAHRVRRPAEALGSVCVLSVCALLSTLSTPRRRLAPRLERRPP